MFKVAKSSAGTSEPPPLPPTTVVADFKRRRKETEAERFAFVTYNVVQDNFNYILILVQTQNILLPGWLRRLRRATRETSQSSMI